MKQKHLKLVTLSLSFVMTFLCQGADKFEDNANLINNHSIANVVEPISVTDKVDVYISTLTDKLTVELKDSNSNMTVFILNEQKAVLKEITFMKNIKSLSIDSQCDSCTFYVKVVDSATKEEFIYKIINTK